jgi:hypothetical protein
LERSANGQLTVGDSKNIAPCREETVGLHVMMVDNVMRQAPAHETKELV